MMSGEGENSISSTSKKNKNNTVVVLGGGGRGKQKLIIQNIWQIMIFRFRRLCLALSTTINHRKNGAGLVKLQDYVETCEYEDIQVMWDMLHKTETDHVIDNRNKRPFSRLFICSSSNHSSKAST